MTEKRYFDEALIFDFTAQVLEVRPLADGKAEIILDKTYFYPTGGGQSCDKGTIADKNVIDVRSENGTVIHTIAGELSLGEVQAQVDKAYRLANMQSHTGQHILSAAFLEALNGETLAVKMSAEGLSTVDINITNLSSEQIEQVEELANQVILENRPIKSYFVPADSPKLEELRRAVKFEKVSGDVRLVEIENFDLSACAGTHFPSTGMLGLLKIIKVENYKGGSRIYFLVGNQALQHFRKEHHIIENLSSYLSSGIDELLPVIQKLQFERQTLSKELANLQERLLRYEVQDLVASASKQGEICIIQAHFTERNPDETRLLGSLLANESQTFALITNQIGADLSVILAASADSNLHAGNILKELLGTFNGRGGGRDNYAQGVLKDFGDTHSLSNTVIQLLS